MDITKVVIPAAGFATNFLPFSKAVPKEMLPLLNKPAIQYVVEEGLQAGIKNFFIVTNKEKQAICNHFDVYQALEEFLKETNKTELLSDLAKIRRNVNFAYVRQAEPLGLGHAVSQARSLIHDKEYFGICLPDDIIQSKTPALEQLMRVAQQERASVVAVQEIPRELANQYGIVTIKKQITSSLFQLSHIIEKPSPKETPSDLAVIGRYILSSKIFDALDTAASYSLGDIQLSDGISTMIRSGERVFAYKIQGTRYDIGNPLGWMKATLSMGLQDPVYGPHLKRYLGEITHNESLLLPPAPIKTKTLSRS